MAVSKLTPVDFQKLLIDNGFGLPKYGADGDWGGETADACETWFGTGRDLANPPPVPPEPDVPADWTPACDMDRVIVHWTAGGYTVSATDREHYHFIVDGNLVWVRGDYSIKANVSTSDADGYAAHTKSFNTKSIGIAAACMAGAIESPFSAGKYPLLEEQWLGLAAGAAYLCRKYGIPVTPTTVLQHGEVQKNCGVPQENKWDIMKLPWAPTWTPENVGNAFRSEVSRRL